MSEGEARVAPFQSIQTGAGAPRALSPTESATGSTAEARLRVLSEVLAISATGGTLVEICRNIGLAICRELGWDALGVWTLDGQSWAMRCVDTWCAPGLGLESSMAAMSGTAEGPGTGLVGSSWSGRCVVWVADSDGGDSSASVLPASARARGVRCGLAFPVKCDDDVLGVIELLGIGEHAPDTALIKLLDTIGAHAALAVLRYRAEQQSAFVQRELETAREQLEAVMECAPAFIATIGRDDSLLFFNKTWPHVDNPPGIGDSWRPYAPPATVERFSAALEQVFKTGTHQFYEIAIEQPDGRAIWMSNHLGPVRVRGEIVAAVVLSQDVTEAKIGQVELLAAQRLASVGTLAAGVAHEINTPVQFVSDSVHFLREAARDVFDLVDGLQELRGLVENRASAPELDAAVAKSAEIAERADLDYLRENVPQAFERALEGLERVARIVRSMKEFSHAGSNEMAPVDLNRAIQTTLVIATNEYKYVADVETELGDIPPVTCHINDINQVVLNLVVNAAHAVGDGVKDTHRRGLIRVKTQQRDEDVIISVSDDGCGIPEEIRARIFDPFFTTKEVGRGTGQGLAIARTIIREKHAGDLTFETRVGVGTTFFVRLPIAGKST
jgi:signal transduction histidine kinase